jgi:hypothetical protein
MVSEADEYSNYFFRLNDEPLIQNKQFSDGTTGIGDDHDVVEAAGERSSPPVRQVQGNTDSRGDVFYGEVLDFTESDREELHPDIRGSAIGRGQDIDGSSRRGVGVDDGCRKRNDWCKSIKV